MTVSLQKHARRPSILLLFAASVAVALIGGRPIMTTLDAQATLTITGYSANHSSIKVFYRPVPGAKDYRVYDVNNPGAVKYAGMTRLIPSTTCPGQYCDKHFVMQSDGVTPVYPIQVANGGSGGAQVIDGPALQIDWNNMGDGAPHTLVVEAVDRLGPVSQATLYTGAGNTPIVASRPAGVMLGGNKGPTVDGKTSTNGQGPYTNNPQVIARSSPFVVQADRGYVAIPSKASALQRFFDTFETAEDATIVQLARNDKTIDSFGNIGMMKYSMNGGTQRAWELEYRQADNLNSMPFVSADHFMDMLFDGATPGAGPTHENIGSMAMTPVQTVDLTGGKILHLTMEVDGHQSQRRWMAFNIAPVSDPLQAWHPDGGIPMNNTNQAVFLEIKDSGCTLDIYTGSTGNRVPTGTAGGATGSRIWGGNSATPCNEWSTYVPGNFGRNGMGFDDKSRFDFYMSATRVAYFQDGHLIAQSAIPAGSFNWVNNGPVKVYFTHYVYHTVNDLDELLNGVILGQPNCYPMNAFWFNDPVNGRSAPKCNASYPPGFGFPYSDERHWDNMGFETFPSNVISASDYAGFLNDVRLPATRPVGAPGPIPTAPNNLRILQ